MIDLKRFKNDLFSINEKSFDKLALETFQFQWNHNQIYQEYCNLLRINPKDVRTVAQIPFLPITFFKSHQIKSGSWTHQKIFKSSGTTGKRSQHCVFDEKFYHHSAKTIFEQTFGPLDQYEILALLPSYLEQGDSSLVSMVDYFIRESGNQGGFFLYNHEELIRRVQESNRPKILFGVSYALLDLISAQELQKSEIPMIIIETGGMKGRKEEITRFELHDQLKSGFHVDSIYSEYGMTELFSQAYGENGNLNFPKWAKIFIRDINDPFDSVAEGGTGAINIIDLANIHTISFVETEDLGRSTQNGTFEVLGRLDNSDVRGCNLLI